jgi:hypothetical protein
MEWNGGIVLLPETVGGQAVCEMNEGNSVFKVENHDCHIVIKIQHLLALQIRD